MSAIRLTLALLASSHFSAYYALRVQPCGPLARHGHWRGMSRSSRVPVMDANAASVADDLAGPRQQRQRQQQRQQRLRRPRKVPWRKRPRRLPQHQAKAAEDAAAAEATYLLC